MKAKGERQFVAPLLLSSREMALHRSRILSLATSIRGKRASSLNLTLSDVGSKHLSALPPQTVN